VKTLTIIRHAKSSWDNHGLSDFQRPLNKRGLRDAPLMAKYYQDRVADLDLIVSSPAVRAKTTAEIFKDTYDVADSQFTLERKIYEAAYTTLLEIINEFSNEYNHVMMFGHNPGFSFLVSVLTGDMKDLPTCSISEVVFDINSWKEVFEGTGILQYFDYPKHHSEMQ